MDRIVTLHDACKIVDDLIKSGHDAVAHLSVSLNYRRGQTILTGNQPWKWIASDLSSAGNAL
jgi:hypothetical protein